MQSQSLAAVVDALHISQIWDRSLPLDDEASRLVSVLRPIPKRPFSSSISTMTVETLATKTSGETEYLGNRDWNWRLAETSCHDPSFGQQRFVPGFWSIMNLTGAMTFRLRDKVAHLPYLTPELRGSN